ncbi:MAG: DUF3047 domain-containing protein [Myxococcota bacterium]
MVGNRPRRRWIPLWAAFGLLLPLGGSADLALPAPTEAAWEPVEFPGVDHTEYRPAENGGVEAIARCSASGRAVRLEGLDLAETPVLRWRWWVTELAPVPAERTKAGDDFAGRVTVMFPFESGRASLLDRVRHEFAERLMGSEVPGTAIHFVWTHEIPAGTVWTSPRATEVKMWALAQGPAPGWQEASIDVGAAYRQAFGRSGPTPVAVALMTDSDDHCGASRALYANFRWTAADGDLERPTGIEPPDASSPSSSKDP